MQEKYHAFYQHLATLSMDSDTHLSSHACLDSEYMRIFHKFTEEGVIRPPYARDTDRILNSMAYTRYSDKTQVFFLVDHIHITHRALHVQMVARVARTIGRALSLNNDLIEAISLGHDIGHPPFGHEGETILNALAKKVGLQGFTHSTQSYRWLEVIEDRDLTLQVLDGILSHNGEEHVYELIPDRKLSVSTVLEKYEKALLRIDCFPSTYEGCVVRLADSIAYVGRDLIDALNVNLLAREDLIHFPELCSKMLGIEDIWAERDKVERRTVDLLVKDVLCASYNQKEIRFSEEGQAFLRAFKEFNFYSICRSPILAVNQKRMERLFSDLYEYYLDDLEHERTNSAIFTDFLDSNSTSLRYKELTSPEQIVIDFLAGMTDRYFEARCKEIVLPTRVEHFSKKSCFLEK
ncbi:MAG: HD domain-containing protein [Euryarchaeota archaeon]|nr:HD domain-containing protein [Euryarchaeota archaeon]